MEKLKTKMDFYVCPHKQQRSVKVHRDVAEVGKVSSGDETPDEGRTRVHFKTLN